MKKVLLIIVVGAFAVSTAMAGPGIYEKAGDRAEIKKDKKEINQTMATYDLLSHTVDLWHDANLKGIGARIAKYDKEIVDIAKNDIRTSEAHLAQYRSEVGRSKAEANRPHVTRFGKADDRADLRDDRHDLEQARTITQIKRRLIDSYDKSDQFSNKYRLINDYLAVLKRELKSHQVELAEDVRELREH